MNPTPTGKWGGLSKQTRNKSSGENYVFLQGFPAPLIKGVSLARLLRCRPIFSRENHGSLPIPSRCLSLENHSETDATAADLTDFIFGETEQTGVEFLGNWYIKKETPLPILLFCCIILWSLTYLFIQLFLFTFYSTI